MKSTALLLIERLATITARRYNTFRQLAHFANVGRVLDKKYFNAIKYEMNMKKQLPYVVVIQVGARRGYVIPRMLEQAEILHSFYTTGAFPDKDGSAMKRLFTKLFPNRMASIERRVVTGVKAEKVHTSWTAEVVRDLFSRLPGSKYRARFATGLALQIGLRTISAKSAKVVLSIDGSGGPQLLRRMKRKGIAVAVDIAVTPLALQILEAAGRDWPHWPSNGPTTDDLRLFRQWYKELVEVADIILYPSDGVLQGLKTIETFDPDKAIHVPYALGTIVPKEPRTVQGRVLFVGSDPIRKGLPYLAKAATILKQRGYNYEFVVAGQISENIRQLGDVSELKFRGHISREFLSQEFAEADVFCLPSLAEGTAAVTLEALASGVPCVVTSATGSPVRDGIDGIVIPERDSVAIADAVHAIISNREKRKLMSRAAQSQKNLFSAEKVKDRLVEALSIVESY